MINFVAPQPQPTISSHESHAHLLDQIEHFGFDRDFNKLFVKDIVYLIKLHSIF